VRALVLGIGGQDGSYLSDLLVKEGVEVFGLLSPTRFPQNFIVPETCTDSQILKMKDFNINCSHKGDFSVFLDHVKPDLIIHLAAVHSHSTGMKGLQLTSSRKMEQVHLVTTENILFWIEKNISSRLFIALSSQMYSPLQGEISIINEESKADPQNHYGITKNDSWTIAKRSRESFGTLVSSGIFFNHTSPRSRPGFLFDTIATQMVEIQKGNSQEMRIRDFNALIDIIHARDAVECIWKIVNQAPNMDFVVGSGQLVSITEVVKKSCIDMGITNFPKFISTESNLGGGTLVSDISKAKNLLGWCPTIAPDAILTEVTQALTNKGF
jgi:GDPmannose 4,6-dehydratase